jgi:hypothetical protein
MVACLAAACHQPGSGGPPWRGEPGSETPNAAGLVSLPCDASTPLEPTRPY